MQAWFVIRFSRELEEFVEFCKEGVDKGIRDVLFGTEIRNMSSAILKVFSIRNIQNSSSLVHMSSLMADSCLKQTHVSIIHILLDIYFLCWI